MATPIWAIEGVALDSTGEMVDGSLGYEIASLFAHETSAESVWPTLANGIDVVSAAVNWQLGNFATIVAANDIATSFHVVNVNIEAIDVNAVFCLVLYSGDGDVEIGRLRFAAVGGFFGNTRYRFSSPLIAANSRIRAKLASSNGGGAIATVRISLGILAHA